MLTEGAAPRAGDAPVEIPMLSCIRLVLGLENDLSMSDDSLFAADRVLVGFFSRFVGPSTFISWATIALDVDLIDLSLDEDPSNDWTAFLCFLLMPELLLLALSLIAEIGGTPVGGRFPVLRYISHY